MKDNLDVSIIIINFNTFQLTCNCIQSIIKNTKKIKYEIILVDNNSNECDPKSFLIRFPDIRLIENNQNVGFGIANNLGMEIAKSDFFVLINSDTYLLNEAIDIAFDFAQNNPQYSIFGADILNEDLTPQKSYFEYSKVNVISAFRHGFIFSNPILRKIIKLNNTSDEIGGLYGAYIFLKRNVFDLTGGFDPDFFMYCEDTEWFRNRIKDKFKIAISKESKIVHLVGRSTKCNLVNKQNVLSYFLYWYKLGKLQFTIYTLGAYLNSIFSLLVIPLMSKKERKRHLNLIFIHWTIINQVLFDIPMYKNKFNGRPLFLKVK